MTGGYQVGNTMTLQRWQQRADIFKHQCRLLISVEIGNTVDFACRHNDEWRFALPGQRPGNFDRQAAAAGNDADPGVRREIEAR